MSKKYLTWYDEFAKVLPSDRTCFLIVEAKLDLMSSIYEMGTMLYEVIDNEISNYIEPIEMELWQKIPQLDVGVSIFKYDKGNFLEQKYIPHYNIELFPMDKMSELIMFQEYNLKPVGNDRKERLSNSILDSDGETALDRAKLCKGKQVIDYNTILFDLDGTLTDSSIGIINSVVYALNKYSIVVEDEKTLFKFIGPPLLESFENYYGFSNEKANEAIEYFREYYIEKGIYENKVYSGIEQLLIELKGRGKTILVATSKAEIFAIQILKHFNLDHYFTYIAGANLDGTRTNKSDVIQYALDSLGSNVIPPVVMIGDREHDINGANSICIDSIGVLFGYGSREELVDAGATYIADTPSDIGKLLLM